MPEAEPRLPPGTSSILSGASENFSFHSSPETFIVNRILQYHKDRPADVDKRTTVRAKILNRNVAVVSSYEQIKQVLDPSDGNVKDGERAPFVATTPYNRLMEPFFPPPNLLLRDGCPHQRSKGEWQQQVQPLMGPNILSGMQKNVSSFMERVPLDVPLDLYATCKDLGWRLFLSTFLGIEPQTTEYNEFEKLQEDLLRGQFSLFPVTVNTGFWHSPRKTGIDARKKLQALIEKRLKTNPPSWLSSQMLSQENLEEAVNHLLMSTSSLAVKGFASMLTALLLNTHLFRPSNSDREGVASWLSSPPVEDQAAKRQAVLKETLRLSPPIVGVMRRATQKRTLQTHGAAEPNVLIPEGWDVWPYFPGGSRDPSVFGADADDFDPLRYMRGDSNPPEPLAFGLGAKRCLGQSFVEEAALAVLEAFQKQKIDLQGTVGAPGVRAWLGWERADPGVWAKDMKQLPTQHPSKPIMVRFVRQQ